MAVAVASPDRYAFKDVSVVITGRDGVIHVGAPITSTIDEDEAQTSKRAAEPTILIGDSATRGLRIRLAVAAIAMASAAFPADGTRAFTVPLKLDPHAPPSPYARRDRNKAQWKRETYGKPRK